MESITQISYIISSSAFLLLAIFYNQRLIYNSQLRAFIIALLGSALWSSLHFMPLNGQVIYSQTIPEILRNALWYYFLIETLGSRQGHSRHQKLHLIWLLSLIAMIAQLFNPALLSEYTHLCLTLIPIAGLFLVEQLYRNTDKKDLKHQKYVYFAIAGIFAFDLYGHIWSHIFQQINPQLEASKGFVSCLTALFFFIGIKNNKGNSSFSVSREAAFYSASLIITGIFLILIALGGYYIKVAGGQLGIFIQSIYLFSFLFVAAVLLTSQKLRASLRVNINKHLFRHKYDYRLEWQRLVNTLARRNTEESVYTLAIRALGQIYQNTPGALWLVEEKQLRLTANTSGLALEDIEQGSKLIRFFNGNNTVLICQEIQQKPEQFEHLELPVFYEHQFWFLSPLISQGDLIGLIGLCKNDSQEPLVWEDFDLIRAVSLQIASFIANENKTQDLMQAKQFDAYSKLTAFIMHDLKNLIAQQSLVVKNAAKHKDNPEFIEDAINTIDNSVKRMSSLLDQLKQDHEVEHASNISLNDILVNTVRKCHNREPRPALRLPDYEFTVRSSAEQLSMIFGHVIRNAQEATEAGGFIDVSVVKERNFASICIEDNGAGMSKAFIQERLFKPFDTTKAAKGMGIGAYQTREFITQAGGNIDIQSEEGQGTRFTIRIPLVDHPNN